MLLGEETFRYDPGHYLISTVVLPVVANVVEATEKRFYLGVQLHLDAAVVAAVMMESGVKPKKSDASVKAMNASLLTKLGYHVIGENGNVSASHPEGRKALPTPIYSTLP